MNAFRSAIQRLLGLAFVCLLSSKCFGFALLGPYEDWMQITNGFRLSQSADNEYDVRSDFGRRLADIGGPMPAGAEYRWNVPVISYAFDQAFVEYFGAEGMHEVESAIKSLNQLPPASQIALTNFPLQVNQLNFAAANEGLIDLRSTALSLLVEQLGLAPPTRNVVVLRQVTTFFHGYYSGLFGFDTNWAEYFYQRNYAPDSYAPSFILNGMLFDFIYYWPQEPGYRIWDTYELPDPSRVTTPAVADGFLNPGRFYSGLSRDDVGGFRYLLSRTNFNIEARLPDVHRLKGHGIKKVEADSVTSAAWRPGVEKITFVRHPYLPKSALSLPLRRRYTDYFFTDGVQQMEPVERVIAQPDILFSVDSGEDTPANYSVVHPVTRTGTSNWINNGSLNGSEGAPGPGVIVPQIKIIFRRLGLRATTTFFSSHFEPTGFDYTSTTRWGTFNSDGGPRTNYPVRKFLQNYTGNMLVRQTRWDGDGIARLGTLLSSKVWKLPVPMGGLALLQSSIDRTNWFTLLTATNDGGLTEWNCYSTNSAEAFRVVPK